MGESWHRTGILCTMNAPHGLLNPPGRHRRGAAGQLLDGVLQDDVPGRRGEDHLRHRGEEVQGGPRHRHRPPPSRLPRLLRERNTPTYYH
jgi:hypothetical protein